MMYDWLMYKSNGVGYALCHGVRKLGSVMTQGLKLATEQAEGYFKIMAVKVNSEKPSQHRTACEISCK